MAKVVFNVVENEPGKLTLGCQGSKSGLTAPILVKISSLNDIEMGDFAW